MATSMSLTSTPQPTEILGPVYRPDLEKPKATVSTQVSHDNVIILEQTAQLIALLTYVKPLRHYGTLHAM